MKKERNQLVLLTYGEVGNFRMRPPSTTPTGTLLVERTFDHHMRPIELPDGSWAVQSTAGGKGGTWLTPPVDKGKRPLTCRRRSTVSPTDGCPRGDAASVNVRVATTLI